MKNIKKMKERSNKKKLSHSIERIGEIPSPDIQYRLDYNYKFRCNQFLENIDNYEWAGIEHNQTKETLIEILVDEFRIALNSVVFNEPAGRAYVEHINSLNQK